MKGFRQTNYLAALIAFLLLIPLCSSTYADNMIDLVESLEDVFPDHFPCVGDTLKGKDGFNISVQGVEYTNGSGLIQARNGEIFVVIDLYMHNGSKKNRAISSLLQFEIYDNNEFKYNNISLYTTGSSLPEGNLAPGASIKGQISYTIPVDVAYPIYLRFDDGACFYLHNKPDFYAFLGSRYFLQACQQKKDGASKDVYKKSFQKNVYWNYRTIEERKNNPASVIFPGTVGNAACQLISGLNESMSHDVLMAFEEYLNQQRSDYPECDWAFFDEVIDAYTKDLTPEDLACKQAYGYSVLGVSLNLSTFAIEGLNNLALNFKDNPKVMAQVEMFTGEHYYVQENNKLALTHYNKCLTTYKKWLNADELKDVAETIKEMKK